MFNKQTDFSKATFDTLVGVNTELNGDISSKGILRIDGKVTGNVNVQGDIFIGEDAYINGDITASNIHIAGEVEGNITTSGVLKLLSSSKLTGDIQVQAFVCCEGSIFDGKCKMVDAPTHKTLIGKKKDYKKHDTINQNENLED